jgi:hypothetical protein
MRKTIAYLAAGLSLALSTTSGSIASEASNLKKTGYYSVTSSNAYNSVIGSQAWGRYDTGCLEKHSKTSHGYMSCLQHISASTLVGGGGY